jgi:hypothetical protein
MFVRRNEGHRYDQYFTMEGRYLENGQIKTNYVTALGQKPSPEDVLDAIDEENLEKSSNDLLRSFYEKAEYVNDKHDDFEAFLRSLKRYSKLEKFQKEKALRKLIVTSLDNLFDNLTTYEVDNQVSEVWLPPARARADIIAQDKKTGEIVVIELKKGLAGHEPISQLNMYINAANEYLDPEDGVRGLVIANEFSSKFELAKENVNNKIDKYSYSLNFELNN